MRPPFHLALLGLLVASPALAGDPDAGHALAQRWCANCHVVEPGQNSGAANGAPTFAAVARMPSTTEASLKVFLQTPHDRMPDLHLSNAERDNVVSYILSLKGPGA
ncbi:MAG: cytochrome c family protein [Acetobacteraceae bacterium]